MEHRQPSLYKYPQRFMIIIKVIGTEFTYTNPSDIETGQKAPFEVTVGTDKVMGGDLSIIDHYAVQVSGQS